MTRWWKSWRSLSGLTRRRLIYIVLAFFLLDFVNILASQERDQTLKHRQEINSLKVELLMAKADLEDTQVAYEDSLRKIVKNLYEEETYGTGGFEIGSHEDIDVLYEVLMSASFDFTSMLENTENYFDKRKEYIEQVPSIWPMEYDNTMRITSGFGWRLSPFTGDIQYHSGIDIASVWNAEVNSSANGIVIETWPPPDGYWRGHPVLGGTVVIKHANGVKTVYGHMSKTLVLKGDVVVRGQVIGIVGATGKAKGRHLHYEVLKNGGYVNPIDYLSSNRILVMSAPVEN